MDRAFIIESVKTSLGYPVVEVEVEDSMIDSFIDISLNYIKEYVDIICHETFTAASFIPFNKGTVLKVYPYDISISDNDYRVNDFDETKVNIIRGTGIYPLSSKELIIQRGYQSQLDSLSNRSFKQTKDGVYLYGYTGNVTFEYEPYRYYLRDLPNDWASWVYKYTLAQTKVCLGRIRSKYKSQSSPFELDGDALIQEGTEEIRQLEDNIYDRGSGLFYIET